jgi:NADH:ubiquinone oxidoreductase subunit E
MMMSISYGDQVKQILERHDRSRENLIAILLDCQEEFTHLPREVVQHVAAELGVSAAAVLGFATFYRRFSLKPVGRHPIHVCMGTACHVKGGQRLLDALGRELRIMRGQTTPDLEFGLDTVNCLGCCGLAPVITVGQNVHGKLKQTDIPKIIKRYKPKEA